MYSAIRDSEGVPTAAAHTTPQHMGPCAPRNLALEAHCSIFMRYIHGGHYARWPRLIVAWCLGWERFSTIFKTPRSGFIHNGHHPLFVAPTLLHIEKD